MNYVDVKLSKQKGRKSTIKAPQDDDQVLYSTLMFTEKNLGELDYSSLSLLALGWGKRQACGAGMYWELIYRGPGAQTKKL